MVDCRFRLCSSAYRNAHRSSPSYFTYSKQKCKDENDSRLSANEVSNRLLSTCIEKSIASRVEKVGAVAFNHAPASRLQAEVSHSLPSSAPLLTAASGEGIGPANRLRFTESSATRPEALSRYCP